MKTTCVDCGRITDQQGARSRRRCAACNRTHRELLDKPLQGAAWRRISAAALAAATNCRHCGVDLTGPAIPGGRADVNHVVPRRDIVHAALPGGSGAAVTRAALRSIGDAAVLADVELEVLCKSCHGKVSQAERSLPRDRGSAGPVARAPSRPHNGREILVA